MHLHLLAQGEPISYTHFIAAVAGLSLITSIAGVLLGSRRSNPNPNMEEQAIRCRYEHEALAIVVDRVEKQSADIIETQREICTSLNQVAGTLIKLNEKLDTHRPNR